jgi:hypothetical protein
MANEPTEKQLEDLRLMGLGRMFERADIMEILEQEHAKALRKNPEHSLHIGFIMEKIKEMPNYDN